VCRVRRSGAPRWTLAMDTRLFHHVLSCAPSCGCERPTRACVCVCVCVCLCELCFALVSFSPSPAASTLSHTQSPFVCELALSVWTRALVFSLPFCCMAT
jgi:hypothetical protein